MFLHICIFLLDIYNEQELMCDDSCFGEKSVNIKYSEFKPPNNRHTWDPSFYPS